MTARCVYVDERNVRCRRVATINGELCGQCARELETFDDQDIREALDRVIEGRVPIATIVADALTGVLGRMFTKPIGPVRTPQPSPSSPRSRSAGPQPGRGRAQPPPAQPAPPDPRLLARDVLGFEPTEKLTKESVQKRRKDLARIFHSDLNGGSDLRMRKINAAADLLLAKLP